MLRCFQKLMLGFLAVLFIQPAEAIVDIERLRKAREHESGLAGETLFRAQGRQGNSQNTVLSFQNNLAYLLDGADWMLIARYRYGESLDVRNANDGFLHLRYSQELNRVAQRWEAYLQGDFNEFQNLIERSLVGSNLRWNIFNSEEKNFSFALGAFAYRERLDVDDPDRQKEVGGRVNAHLVYAAKLLSKASFATGIYFQPKINEWEDIQALANITFESPLTTYFSLSLSIEYRYDSEPPGDIEKYDLAYTSGLKYTY